MNDPNDMIGVISSVGLLDKKFDLNLSEVDFKKIYRAMVLTRAFDTKSMNMQRQGRIGFYVLAPGRKPLR